MLAHIMICILNKKRLCAYYKMPSSKPYIAKWCKKKKKKLYSGNLPGVYLSLVMICRLLIITLIVYFRFMFHSLTRRGASVSIGKWLGYTALSCSFFTFVLAACACLKYRKGESSSTSSTAIGNASFSTGAWMPPHTSRQATAPICENFVFSRPHPPPYPQSYRKPLLQCSVL